MCLSKGPWLISSHLQLRYAWRLFVCPLSSLIRRCSTGSFIALLVFTWLFDAYGSMRSTYASLLTIVLAFMTVLVWLVWGQDGRISLGGAPRNMTKRGREKSIQKVARGLYYAVLATLAQLAPVFRIQQMFIAANVIWFASLVRLFLYHSCI
jgi:hypothetical protein